MTNRPSNLYEQCIIMYIEHHSVNKFNLWDMALCFVLVVGRFVAKFGDSRAQTGTGWHKVTHKLTIISILVIVAIISYSLVLIHCFR